MEIEEHNGQNGSYLRNNTSIRRILRKENLEEWAGVLESRGVCTVEGLRQVKYADLVQYGVTEFEPRKRIFELIKKINAQVVASSPEQRDILYSPRQKEVAQKVSALYTPPRGTSPMPITWKDSSPAALWKRKKEMVLDLMEEAETSIIEEDSRDSTLVEETHLCEAESNSIFSDPNSLTQNAQEAQEACEAEGSNSALLQEEDIDIQLGRICVIVRKRPIKNRKERDALHVQGKKIVLTEQKQRMDLTPYIEPHSFVFDRAFSETRSTEEIYKECIKGLVEHTLSGGNAACIAYGQTGSGKTYTMLNEATGIIPLAVRDLLRGKEAKVSFYEIYGNHIYDLLEERKKIFAREKDGVVSIVGVKEKSIYTVEEAMESIKKGLLYRTAGRTGANKSSSRSHALFRVRICGGVLTFVDLAGSERGSERAGEEHDLVKREGAEINKSLLALKECIRAMDRSATHLPFRQSRLTQVLKESLIGDSKCCVIATLSPESSSAEHTLNTLRYAFRIRQIGVKSEAKEGSVSKPSPSVNRRYMEVSAPIQKESGRAERPVEKPVKTQDKVSDAQRAAVYQALAAVAARAARETDPSTLEMLKKELVMLAGKEDRRK